MLWPFLQILLITASGFSLIICLGFDVRAKHRPLVG